MEGSGQRTKEFVLCIARRDGTTLLGRKAPRNEFSKAHWNFPGGKIEPGQSPRDAAFNEFTPETGHTAADCRAIGVLNCHFQDSDILRRVHVFEMLGVSGDQKQLTEDDEFKELRWWPEDAVPYDQMLKADKLWHPCYLAGQEWPQRFVYDNTTNWELIEPKDISPPE